MGEFHPQAQVTPASPPVYIIQQPIPWTPGSQTVQNPYLGNPPYPNPQAPTSPATYSQPGPTAYQGKPTGATGNIPRPIISERKVTVPPPPPRQAPEPKMESTADINSVVRPEPRPEAKPDPRQVQQPMPISQGEGVSVSQDVSRDRAAPIPQQVQVVAPKPVYAGEPPKRPARTVGFTEFQLPDEDELFYESHQQNQPIEKAEAQPTQSVEAMSTKKAQPIFSSKFYSLHDSMTHSGKQYSEEELDQKILD